MSSAVHHIREAREAPQHRQTQARQALRRAIKAQQRASAELAKIAEAIESAEAASHHARTQLTAAEDVLNEARKTDNVVLAAQALGESIDGIVPLEVAQAEQTSCQNDLAICRRTVIALTERHAHQEAEVVRCRRAVDEAVTLVIGAEMPADTLLEAAKCLQADLVDVRLRLRFLQRRDCIDDAVAAGVRSLLFRISLPAGYGQAEFENWDHHPTHVALAAAADAMREDPDAAMPR